VKTDISGNLIAIKKCGKENAKKMLIAAHLDEVGLMVTGHEDGYLSFAQVGGVDQRMLPARDLVINTNPPLVGVVCALPPHVLKAEDMKKAIDMADLRIDVGMSQAEAVKKIPVGTTISFRTEGFDLGEDYYVSKTLDDRSCFVALVKAAELLSGRQLPWDVVFVGSVCEEVGGEGAALSVYEEAPLVCIAIDVTFGKTPDHPGGEQGFELGGGPVVTMGPNISKTVRKGIISAAKDKRIPVQHEVAAGHTGTDAWTMQTAREGVATGLIGLPLRYMHTPVETVSISDIQLCAELVAEYAVNPGEEVLELC